MSCAKVMSCNVMSYESCNVVIRAKVMSCDVMIYKAATS